MKYIISLLIATTSFVSQPLQNDNGWRPAWGLDRIDQRESVLNDTYNYNLTGEGVNVYVFDSGINSTHEEFEGRVDSGHSVVNDDFGVGDCSGHGTHSASIIGGKTYGVAKKVRLIPVRVLNCRNGNSSPSSLYSAIDWILQHHLPGVPAIVNMSVGMSKSNEFNEAVRKLIADGLIVVVAAGNQGRDACLYSPGSEPSAITVGGVDKNELRASQSNFGECIDIFAPGWDIVAGWTGSNSIYRSSSGTSNAAPIVSGIVAMMLQENPAMTQQEVDAKLKSTATAGALFNIGANSPNLLAYSSFSLTGVPSVPVTTTTVPVTTTTVPVTTTTVPVTTTVPPVTTTIPPTTPIPVENMTCTTPAARTYLFGVPYVCVNTGNQLMWIPRRYSPTKP